MSKDHAVEVYDSDSPLTLPTNPSPFLILPYLLPRRIALELLVLVNQVASRAASILDKMDLQLYVACISKWLTCTDIRIYLDRMCRTVHDNLQLAQNFVESADRGLFYNAYYATATNTVSASPEILANISKRKGTCGNIPKWTRHCRQKSIYLLRSPRQHPGYPY